MEDPFASAVYTANCISLGTSQLFKSSSNCRDDSSSVYIDLPFDITQRPLALAAESPFSSDSRRQTAAHIPRPCTQRSHPAARSPPEASRELRGRHRAQ